MKYNLLCFQISGRLIILFNKHDYQVLTSLMKENKRYKRLNTAKWISIRKLGQISWMLILIVTCRQKMFLMKNL